MAVIFLLFCSIGLSLVFPYITKIIIDEAIPTQDYDYLETLIIIMFAIVVLRVVTFFFSNYLFNWVGNQILVDMRNDLFKSVISSSMAFHEKREVGDIVHRIYDDISVIKSFMTKSILGVISCTITLIGTITILIWMDAWLFLASVIFLPILFFNAKFFQNTIRSQAELIKKKSADLMDFLMVKLRNVKLVHSYNAQAYECNKNDSIARGLCISLMDNVKSTLTQRTISSFCMSLGPLIIFAWGGYRTMTGAITLGVLVAFLQYLARLIDPIRELNRIYLDGLNTLASMKRVLDLKNSAENLQDKIEKVQLAKFDKIIRFKDVELVYDSQVVLDKINLEIESGKKYAIVGHSGSGKTSIVNLLCKFYLPTSGTISIDGQNIQEFDDYSFREHIGLVSQEDLLFQTSIEENIRYGNWEKTDDEMEKVTGLLDLQTNRTLTDKTDAHLLSGGQKQRVAIARGLLRGPDLLILDESTSALDSESENKILQILGKYYNKKTVILISHRLSAVKHVDIVYCLSGGKIIEQGSPEELLGNRGYFWKLFQHQT